jgi:hypothetical protein
MRLAGTIALAVALFGCSERPKLERLAPAERNVRDMVKLAQSRGVAVLLIGTPEPGFTVSPPAFYAGIARQHRLPYEGAIIGEVLRDRSLKADPTHPNKRGYRFNCRAPCRSAKGKRSDLRRSRSCGRSRSHTRRSARQR